MDFRQLRYVVAIAEYQNMTRAAEALYVGQPTLSKFLMSLEDELGMRLFRRQGHRFVPTYAGERYVVKARQILQLGEDLNAEMSDILEQDIGILRVAFAPMRGSYMLPRVLPIFGERHPNVKIIVMEGDSETNDHRLLNGQADLAFYSKPAEENPMIDYTILTRDELLFCTAPNHPFASKTAALNGLYPRIDLSQIQNERVLLLSASQRTRQITDDILHRNKVQLRETVEITNMQAAMGLVASGYGVAFFFDCHLCHRIDQRPIDCFQFGEEPTLSDFVAATRKGDYLPNHALDFIDIVRQEAAVSGT